MLQFAQIEASYRVVPRCPPQDAQLSRVEVPRFGIARWPLSLRGASLGVVQCRRPSHLERTFFLLRLKRMLNVLEQPHTALVGISEFEARLSMKREVPAYRAILMLLLIWTTDLSSSLHQCMLRC